MYDWLLSADQAIAGGTQVTAAWDQASGRYYVTGAMRTAGGGMRFWPGCDCCCVPAEGWAGPGWYCVDSWGFGQCLSRLLADADRCKDIIICDGPFDTKALADAACPPAAQGVPPAATAFYRQYTRFHPVALTFDVPLGTSGVGYQPGDVVFMVVHAFQGHIDSHSAIFIIPPAGWVEVHTYDRIWTSTTSVVHVILGYLVLPDPVPGFVTFRKLGTVEPCHWEAYVQMCRPITGFASLANAYTTPSTPFVAPATPVPDNAQFWAFLVAQRWDLFLHPPAGMSQYGNYQIDAQQGVLACIDSRYPTTGAPPPATPERVWSTGLGGSQHTGVAWSLAIF